ncbi:hypothetical protein ACWGDT_20795 [Streptomyces avermitilis]
MAVIAVPTPLCEGVPDLSYVLAAGRTAGRYLREGALVVLKSTSCPGTTRDVLGPVLEEVSGLRMGSRFALGFSRNGSTPATGFGLSRSAHDPPTLACDTPLRANSSTVTLCFYRARLGSGLPLGEVGNCNTLRLDREAHCQGCPVVRRIVGSRKQLRVWRSLIGVEDAISAPVCLV